MADRTGERFGHFEVLERIGGGGNADVYRATDGERDVAIKLLRTRQVDSEPYARFRREIAILGALGERPGILPLLDHHLPERLTSGQRAWLAMPIAARIDHALVDAELAEIVAAIAAIAETLAALQANPGLAHRDLKPQNLYVYGDGFAVGDFGLVSYPDAERLTAPGKVIGPANFVAYEMMENPLSADPAPADVYSLAKTLWVLVTGSRWPPPGHQRAGDSPSVGAYRPHPRAGDLDALVDRATRFNGAERPTMSTFAADLTTWLDLPRPKPELSDLAEIGAELQRRAAPHIEASDAADRRSAAAYALYERFEQRLEPAAALISQSFPNVGGADGAQLTSMLGTTEGFGEARVTVRYAAGGSLRGYDEFDPVLLRYGGLIEVVEDGNIRVRVGIELGRSQTLGGSAWIGEAAEAAVESLAAQALIDAAVDDLVQRLPEWARRFSDETG